MDGHEAVAIVLARAGSRGLPGKNVAPIAGRPCLAWTLDHAIGSGRIARVVVSTDDPIAAMVALGMDCEVVDRPVELASDAATVDDAARDALARIEDGAALPATCPIVILYANVPVRPAGLIDRAISRLVRTGCDSVQSFVPVGKHHPWWTVRIDGTDPGEPADAEGIVRPWEGSVLHHGVYRRQDLPSAYVPDGGVIAVTRQALTLGIPDAGQGPHAFLGIDRRGITTREGEVIDVDSAIDLRVADAVLRETVEPGGIEGEAA